jgi:homopolymeric O-antigen transport system permease protein
VSTTPTRAVGAAELPVVPGRPGAGQAPKPVVEVHGGRGRLDAASFEELWRFRSVLTAFAVRYVKIKYKQAAIGIGWAFVQPVAAAAIFALFLGHFANIGSDGVPYLLFALTGMVVWTYFSSACTAGSESLVYHEALLRKVYFPREILPLAALLASLVDLLPAFATLAVAASLFGYFPSVVWLALPLPLLLLVTSAVAFSVALSAINVFYRDVRYALPFLLQLAFFATPVVYSLETIPAGWRDAYAVLNPIAGVIDSVRRIVLHSSWPQFGVLGAALVWTGVLSLMSYALFKRLEREFADRV